MQLAPYIYFGGNCEAAFKFYEQCLGGKIVMMLRSGESPIADQVPAERHQDIMHARLELPGGQYLMASDAPPDHHRQAAGFSVSLTVSQPAEAERIFKAMAQDGSVFMQLQPTFWSAAFAMVTDRFGIPWMINCELPA